jgi:DNA-binding IclR family transcriptional regulator
MHHSHFRQESKVRKTKVVQSVVRAAKILKAFTGGQAELGITKLSEIVGLPVSSVYRIVSSLESEGLIEQDIQNNKYRLSLEIFILGSVVLNHMRLGRDAFPHMKWLAELSGETVNVGALRQGVVVYLQKIESEELLRASLTVGSQVPAHCTAIGKVLLAHLREGELDELVAQTGLKRYGPNTITSLEELKKHLQVVRQRGFSIDDEEFGVDMRCIGAPIRDHTGMVVAGIAIAGPASRLTYETLESLKGPVMEAAEGISRRLGYSP